MSDINAELRLLEGMIERSFRVAGRYLTQDDIADVRRSVVATMHRSKTAGEVKFVKQWEQDNTSTRNFDGEWQPNGKARKTLAKALWSLAMAFGHIHTGYRIFSKVRASQVSPDGLMGGRGYIKPIKEMRSKLAEAVEILSDVTDTLHDDLNGPQYEQRAEADTKKLLSEAQEVLENPDQVDEVEEESTVADDVAAEADSAPEENLGKQSESEESDEESEDKGSEKKAFTRRIARRLASRMVALRTAAVRGLGGQWFSKNTVMTWEVEVAGRKVGTIAIDTYPGWQKIRWFNNILAEGLLMNPPPNQAILKPNSTYEVQDLVDYAEHWASKNLHPARRASTSPDPAHWPSHYFTREHQYAPTDEPDRDLPVNNWSEAFASDVPLSDRFVEDVNRTPTYGVGPRDDGTNPWTF